MAIPASLTAVPAPRMASDGPLTENYTIPASGPFANKYQLGSTAPLNYPTGIPIVPPTGTDPVLTTGGVAYTKVASGTTPAQGQYSYTTSTDINGGVITHAAADAGKAVTVVYVGDTIWTETYVTLIRSALSDVAAALGAPNGLATFDASGYLIATATEGDLNVRGHLRHGATAPTFTASSNGASGTVVYGDDKAGVIQFTTIAAPAAGLIGTLNFGAAYVNPPVIVFGGRTTTGVTAVAPKAHDNGTTTTGAQVILETAPAGSTTYLLSYLIIE